MRLTAPPRLAAALDALGIAAFVVAGRENHEISGGVVWFLTVFWPFAVGWFFVALLTHLYNQPKWRSLSITWLGGVGIGFVLRAAVTQRGTPIVFILVATTFIFAINFGWRAIWIGTSKVLKRA